MTKHRAARVGFTIVELMMSLAVLTVGISGIIAMQKVTAMSNLHSKSIALATQIANSWQDQLLVDGSVWRNTTNLTPTTWLKSIGSNQNVWFRPQYDPNRRFGPGFDALGNPVAEANIARAQFCVYLLFAPVTSLGANNPGNGIIRATIRVMWPRTQGQVSTNFCTDNDITALGDDVANYHSIYQTLAIRVNP